MILEEDAEIDAEEDAEEDAEDDVKGDAYIKFEGSDTHEDCPAGWRPWKKNTGNSVRLFENASKKCCLQFIFLNDRFAIPIET